MRAASIRLAAATLLLALAGAGGCAQPLVNAEWEPLSEAAGEEIDGVVFLVGDAGKALPGRSPVLARLATDVEAWSARLARDSAVSVLYLGDIVYPDGVHAPGSAEFPQDSLHVQAQVDVLSGPAARRHHTLGVFLAGNHDWGQTRGDEGITQVRHLEDLLEAMAREQDVEAKLFPEAGAPGPHVLDVADRIRLLLLDTHWWLQARNSVREDSVILAVEEGISTAGDREIVLAAHHPFLSGGSHGGPMPIWEGLGLLYLLRRTGSLVQDLNSVPYRQLRLGLRGVFGRTRRPLVWAGGHDHSLQVVEATREDQPRWNLVSGSGSKLTDVAPVRGLLFGADRPGYMRLTFLENGEVHLHVIAADDRYLLCDGDDTSVETCMEEGPAAFDVVWTRRLR